MILLIDNFDSFAHNLARYFVRLGAPVHVVRNDAGDGRADSPLAAARHCPLARTMHAERSRLLTRRRAGLLE